MSWKWEGDLITNLNGMDAKVKLAMVAAAKYVAPQAEQHMKNNATWTDRTGAARNGLATKVVSTNDTVAIVLFHTAPYGVFLEVRWGGKYSIVEPTIHAMAPLFVETIGRLISEGI